MQFKKSHITRIVPLIGIIVLVVMITISSYAINKATVGQVSLSSFAKTNTKKGCDESDKPRCDGKVAHCYGDTWKCISEDKEKEFKGEDSPLQKLRNEGKIPVCTSGPAKGYRQCDCSAPAGDPNALLLCLQTDGQPIQSDNLNCGSVGNKCNTKNGESCINGKCIAKAPAIPACPSGWFDEDGIRGAAECSLSGGKEYAYYCPKGVYTPATKSCTVITISVTPKPTDTCPDNVDKVLIGVKTIVPSNATKCTEQGFNYYYCPSSGCIRTTITPTPSATPRVTTSPTPPPLRTPTPTTTTTPSPTNSPIVTNSPPPLLTQSPIAPTQKPINYCPDNIQTQARIGGITPQNATQCFDQMREYNDRFYCNSGFHYNGSECVSSACPSDATSTVLSGDSAVCYPTATTKKWYCPTATTTKQGNTCVAKSESALAPNIPPAIAALGEGGTVLESTFVQNAAFLATPDSDNIYFTGTQQVHIAAIPLLENFAETLKIDNKVLYIKQSYRTYNEQAIAYSVDPLNYDAPMISSQVTGLAASLYTIAPDGTVQPLTPEEMLQATALGIVFPKAYKDKSQVFFLGAVVPTEQWPESFTGIATDTNYLGEINKIINSNL